MAYPSLHRAAGFLPPPIRRAASGLWLDLKSLPARLADPARRGDPWSVAHNVGEGDFREIGDAILRDLLEFGGLTERSRVLDIGCGAGRAALPLAERLGPEGGYVGFDVSRRAVHACRRRFARLRPEFRFEHADVRNGDYNAEGSIPETSYRFPCEDGSVDLAFATSVFSHMRKPSIAHYVKEAARALAPGGRLLFTAYALTPERRQAIEAGRSAVALVPWREGAMVMDPRSPERAIAHDAESLLGAICDAGLLAARPWLPGSWCGEAEGHGFQDLFVAAKAEAS